MNKTNTTVRQFIEQCGYTVAEFPEVAEVLDQQIDDDMGIRCGSKHFKFEREAHCWDQNQNPGCWKLWLRTDYTEN